MRMRACASTSSWPRRNGSDRARARRPRSSGARSTSTAPRLTGDAAPAPVAGDVVRALDRPPRQREATAANRPLGDLDVIFEDDVLIVVNKPAGLLSVPLERKADAPSVYEQIEDRLRSLRQAPSADRSSHRSGHLRPRRLRQGCGAQRRLKAQFARREPERVYLAVVYGRPTPRAGDLARHAGVGHQGADPEGNPPPRSARHRRRSPNTGWSRRSATRR